MRNRATFAHLYGQIYSTSNIVVHFWINFHDFAIAHDHDFGAGLVRDFVCVFGGSKRGRKNNLMVVREQPQHRRSLKQSTASINTAADI